MFYDLKRKTVLLCVTCFAVCFCSCQDALQSDGVESSISVESKDLSYENSDFSEVSDMEPDGVYLDELIKQVFKTALNPKEPMPSETISPGTKLPPQYLMRATDEFIGDEVTIYTEAENKIVFAFYPKVSNREEILLILYSDADLEKSFLLILQTEYGHCETLLKNSSCWTGTIKDIIIIDTLDYIYPRNVLEPEPFSVDKDTEICFGSIYSKEISACDNMKCNASPIFNDVYSRFGIILP